MAPRPKKSARTPTSAEIAEQTREFLRRGGRIKHIPDGVSGDKRAGTPRRGPQPMTIAKPSS